MYTQEINIEVRFDWGHLCRPEMVNVSKKRPPPFEGLLLAKLLKERDTVRRKGQPLQLPSIPALLPHRPAKPSGFKHTFASGTADTAAI